MYESMQETITVVIKVLSALLFIRFHSNFIQIFSTYSPSEFYPLQVSLYRAFFANCLNLIIMTRAKKILIPVVSHEEAEQAMAVFTRSNTQLKLLEGKIEQEKQQIDNKYQMEIAGLKNTMEEQVEVLQVYGQRCKESWKGKSLELVHGKIGFRTGNPKLVKNKKFTWDAVTELLKKAFPSFVRTTYEINKEALIAARDKEEFEEIRNACYIDVVQDESFYVEAKAEELSVAYSIHR